MQKERNSQKMRVILLFFIFLYSFSYGENIVKIDTNFTEIKEFQVGYIIDNEKKLTFEDIQSMKFIEGKNGNTFGANTLNTWVKIEFENITKNKQTLFLHQDEAFTLFSIDFYEVNSQGKLLQKKEINIYDADVKKDMLGADAVFKFTLDAFEKKTIYVQQQTVAYHYYNFLVFSESNSIEYLIFEKIDSVLFVGLLLALALYNLMIYITSRYKEYLYYSLYLFTASIWVLYIYGGLAHYFHMYGALPFKFNFAMVLLPLFLALFIQTILETKRYYKTEHIFLNIMIWIMSLTFIYGFINFAHALQLLSIILNYTLITFLWISISIYKKGNKIIKIFLVAHIFYIILNVYALTFYTGIGEYSYLSSHGIGIGIIIEALILSYLVSYKFKIAEEEKQVSQLLLLEKSKMADMGEIVANIAHQWRQPLATVSICSAILQEKKLLGKLTDEDLKEELGHIDSNVAHMSQTVEDFLTYFRPNKIKADFFVLDAVGKALLIIGNTLCKNDIEIIVDVNKEYKIFGFKEEYVQVLISIISNAIYALEHKDIKIIKISATLSKKSVKLSIEDTAGGIKKELLGKIFDPYFTTKHQSSGTGLGLYISKNIIEKSMNGTLEVENTKKGAKFSIII